MSAQPQFDQLEGWSRPLTNELAAQERANEYASLLHETMKYEKAGKPRYVVDGYYEAAMEVANQVTALGSEFVAKVNELLKGGIPPVYEIKISIQQDSQESPSSSAQGREG